MRQLKEPCPEPGSVNSAVRQVALADLVIVNKVDLVAPEELNGLRKELRRINGPVEMIETQRCKVKLDHILDLKAYSGSAQIPRFEKLKADVKAHAGTAHLDKDVLTVTFDLPLAVTSAGLERFLTRLLWENACTDSSGVPVSLIRLKGVVSVCDEPQPRLVQAVYDRFNVEPIAAENSADQPNCRFIFIGRNLEKECLLKFFKQECCVD